MKTEEIGFKKDKEIEEWCPIQASVGGC